MATSTTTQVRRSEVYFAEKDRALRDDVHLLGELVGELIREQGGEALFDLVEAARQASIRNREGEAGEFESLHSLLTALAPATAREFIRAFSTYFQMVNMAETVHRIRRRRAYSRDSATPQPFSFTDTLQRLKSAGISDDDVERCLAQMCIEPVLAPHPTEATRRSLLRKQQNIARLLVQMLDPYMTLQERNAALGQIRADMSTGWQTEEHPGEQLQVGDEAEHVLFFLTDVLYRMIPPFYENLEDALAASFPERAGRMRPPLLVRFGSCVGGDMDGNPNITGKSIRETLARQRLLVLDLYFNECRSLVQQLSQTESRIAFSADVYRQIARYSGYFPKAAHSVSPRHRKMPYRILLRLMQARLQATYDDAAFPYETADEFIEDIERIAASLRANKGRNAGLFAVQRLLRRAQTFGFHIATLDIRQDARVHRRVVAEGLQESAWFSVDSAARARRLCQALDRRESPALDLSSEGRRTLSVFQTIAHCRRKYGPASIGPYIVSRVEGPDDILSVLLLAKWGHLGPKSGAVPLDIAPLFETPEDLQQAPGIMAALFADPGYRTHLRHRADEQIVMVGHADSNARDGLMYARWALYELQRELLELARAAGIRLTLFQGRGSTLTRGGVRMNEALLAAPPGAVAGRLRMTEEGETINAKYGLRGIAMRSLEQTVSSVLSLIAQPPAVPVEEREWREIMQVMAERSRARYRELVSRSPEFMQYFRLATPLDVIERLEHAAKPWLAESEHERAGPHAMPWAFAWTQNRCLLPSWFGFAAGLEQSIERFGMAELRRMFEEWHVFRVLVTDVEMALAKADMGIMERYSRLTGELHETFFSTISAEYARSVALVLSISGQSRLLETSDTLRRAIRLRNPYVDPMSLLQVNLLQRWRADGRPRGAMLEALMASVNGIAYGMQSTA